MSYDTENKRWTATYPLQKNLEQLHDNISSVIRRLKSLEKRLNANGPEYAETYRSQIADMLSRNAAREMNKDDWDYAGAVHYIPHHEVIKRTHYQSQSELFSIHQLLIWDIV